MKAMTTVALTGAVIAALVGAAWAGGSQRKDADGAGLGEQEIRARLEAQGYKVREIEREHGRFEVEARDQAGKKVELQVSAADGSLIADDESNKNVEDDERDEGRNEVRDDEKDDD